MEEEIDPYERQLLAVFKSCDGNGSGVLDEDGFNQLCDALQLEETHRNLLTTRLCFGNKCHVEFPQFRDALLAVLASLKSPTSDCDDQTSFYEEIDNRDSSKRVFGGKKYGRRSRPNSTDQDEEKYGDPLTPDGEDTFESEIDMMGSEHDGKKSKSRSSSIDDYEIDSLCKHLGVHKSHIIGPPEIISICNSMGITNSVYDLIQEKINNIISQTNSVDKTGLTYGQFFHLIKKLGYTTDSSAIAIPSTNLSKAGAPFNDDGISSIDINASGYDTLVYLFENAGISDAGIFLNDLGISPQFDVNLSELAGQLQEELLNVQRCMDDSSNQLYTLLNPHLLLLQASVVVSQAQIKWYRLCMEQMQCERDKLKNDLMIANERASLLAQEVDDNHARMEYSVQQKLKLLEQKHTDQIKKLTYQWSVEREQLTNQNLKMEKQLEQLLHDETKLRSEVASLKQDYENLEKENQNLLDQLVNAENMRDELEREIQRLSQLKKKVLELESSNEQAISFLEKMNQLQAENIMLRDKNDELAIELENVAFKSMQNRNGGSKRRGNLPLEVEENSDTDMTIATHRMFPKVRKYSTEKDLSVSIDGTHSENVSIGLMTHCESGVEADISTSSSSLERVGDTIAEANENAMLELKSRVVFLENFIKKYRLKATNNDNDADYVDRAADRCADDLEKQCETLQQRLDQVQKEILKILSEKRACSEENCALKLQISELMTRLPGGSDFVADQAHRADGRNVPSASTTFSPANEQTWPHGPMAAGGSSQASFENRVLCDAEALRFVENESRLAEPPTPEKAAEVLSMPTQTVDTSCSSMLTAVSEEENEMEWKTIGDERKPSEEVAASGSQATVESGTSASAPADAADKKPANYETLLLDYNRLANENKTLSDKCEELSSCLEALRSEYDSCEEYWASKLDEERRLSEEEQRISDEKFAELQIKIDEYSEMFGAESMSSKLPPIAENDKLEKEVNDLQEEFKVFKEKMESENQEKQNEIERLMRIINLYENSDPTVKQMNLEVEHSLESLKSDKTYVLDQPSNEYQDIPNAIDEGAVKLKTTKLNDLKNRKKQLKKDCDKLEHEKEKLMEHLVKMMSESRMTYNFTPCSHAVQQHNSEISKSGILLRLRHQEMKNRHLRNVLLQQQKKVNKTMREMLEQHEKELAKYRSALASSQEMWQSLQTTTKKQAKQISEADEVAKDLYCENAQLRATIHQLEQQHLDCPSPVLL